MSCILLRVCSLFWKEFEHSEKYCSKTKTDSPEKITTVVKKFEINLQYFTNDTSDSKLSEETVYSIEPINLLTIFFFSDTDIILASSQVLFDNKFLTSASPVSEINSKFSDTGSTKQNSISSEKNCFSENSIFPTIAAQRPPPSPIPVASAITAANASRPIGIPDPSDLDPPYPLQLPPLTNTVAGKSKSFKHRKSTDPIFCDQQTISALQKKIIELITSANLLDLKTTSDISSDTISLLYPRLSSILYSSSSADDILNCESKS